MLSQGFRKLRRAVFDRLAASDSVKGCQARPRIGKTADFPFFAAKLFKEALQKVGGVNQTGHREITLQEVERQLKLVEETSHGHWLNGLPVFPPNLGPFPNDCLVKNVIDGSRFLQDSPFALLSGLATSLRLGQCGIQI